MHSKTFITPRKILYTLALAAAAVGNAQAQNLLVNGGFETGDLTGWTSTTGTFGGHIYVGTGAPHTGTYAINLAGVTEDASTYGQISQSFATVVGAQYQLNFWSLEGGALLNASVNNATVYSSTGDGSAYRSHTFTFTATAATSSIKFQGYDYYGILLDDVAVTAVGAVPEPSQWALMGLGLLAMGAVVRRRQRSIVTG